VLLVAAVAGVARLGGKPGRQPTSWHSGTLFRDDPAPEVQLASNAPIAAGDLLRTGGRSSAEILCPEAAARFRIAPKTRARLASEAPGVLLELEEGRLHAFFEKLGGDSGERLGRRHGGARRPRHRVRGGREGEHHGHCLRRRG
jgi:hypothetical protein